MFKPSTPEFTLYLVNHPFDVPPTTPIYTTDPYTGETKLQTPGSPGYRVDNWTIELWIPNKQFNYPSGSTTYQLYYDVRTKGHFEQNWRELYAPFSGLHSGNYSDSGSFVSAPPAQLDHVYTVITYSAYTPPAYSYPQVTYPPNAQIDFQISSILGHNSQIFVDDHPFIPQLIGHQEPAIAYDIQSDWSNTQTITISNSSLSTATLQNEAVSTSFAVPVAVPSTPTPTPTVPEIPTLVILPIFAVLISSAIVLKLKKKMAEQV